MVYRRARAAAPKLHDAVRRWCRRGGLTAYLAPGAYISNYLEHSFLEQQLHLLDEFVRDM